MLLVSVLGKITKHYPYGVKIESKLAIFKKTGQTWHCGQFCLRFGVAICYVRFNYKYNDRWTKGGQTNFKNNPT